MDLYKLDTPFPPNEIEWRAQSCGEKNGKFWVMCLAYVTNRAIMNRLDDICGKAGWKNEYRDIAGGGVECGLSIKIGDEWVTKWDAAEETNIEAVKGGRSGAMKRAAVQWGIGRYLYNLEEGWGVVSDNGIYSAKTKDGKWFKWSPPQLPSWALPVIEKTTLNESQIKQLSENIVAHGYSVESACKAWGIGSLSDIDSIQFDNIMATVRTWKARD